MLMPKFKLLFLPPDDKGAAPAPSSGSTTKEDIVELLGEDDDKEESLELEDKPVKEKVKEEPKEEEPDEEDETKEDDEEDELKELEEELEGPSEEQLELVTPVRRREILKKYPNLFKEFPYLEKAYYREQQFTEILPTIDDAKEAVEKATTLDNFEKDLMNGNTETILKTLHDRDRKGFNKLVDNYMSTLARVDDRAYHHVLGNTIKHTIVAMVQEANRSNNDALKAAAQILNQFTFGSSDFQPPTNLSNDRPEEDDREKEIKQKTQDFARQQFESTRTNLNTKISNVIKSTISSNIDPRKGMSDYVKSNAERDAREQLIELMGKDQRLTIVLDKLWKNAFDKNFSEDSVAQIKSAYLSKAKTLLPSVLKMARIKALKGTGKRVSDDDSDKSPITPGRPRSQSSSGKKTSKAGDIPKGMTTLEFLNQD